MRHLDVHTIARQARGPRRARPTCFTLVELIVVVVIVAILAAVGTGVYSRSGSHHRLDAAIRRIEADLSLARQQALSAGAAQSVQFVPGTGQYSLPGVQALDDPSSDYTVDLASAPYEVTIDSADFDGDAQLRFDAFGKPDSGGTLVLSAGDRQISLTVSSDGGKVLVP